MLSYTVGSTLPWQEVTIEILVYILNRIADPQPRMLMLLIDAGLLHIGQIGAMKIAGTSTVCIALMMLGRTLQVNLKSTLTQGNHLPMQMRAAISS